MTLSLNEDDDSVTRIDRGLLEDELYFAMRRHACICKGSMGIFTMSQSLLNR